MIYFLGPISTTASAVEERVITHCNNRTWQLSKTWVSSRQRSLNCGRREPTRSPRFWIQWAMTRYSTRNTLKINTISLTKRHSALITAISKVSASEISHWTLTSSLKLAFSSPLHMSVSLSHWLTSHCMWPLDTDSGPATSRTLWLQCFWPIYLIEPTHYWWQTDNRPWQSWPWSQGSTRFWHCGYGQISGLPMHYGCVQGYRSASWYMTWALLRSMLWSLVNASRASS